MTKTCAVLYTTLGPYHIARLRALAKVLPETHAIEVADEQDSYPWRPGKANPGFALSTLFPEKACESVPAVEQCRTVKVALSHVDPAVVVVAGYTQPAMQAAARWAQKRGISTVLLFTSTHDDKPRKWWKELFKKRIIQGFSAIAATGQRSEEYARELGVRQETIFRIGNVVDNTYFLNSSEVIRRNGNQQRSRLNLPANYFLAVSRLCAEKNYPRLLVAFDEYRKSGGKWDVVIVGGGPQEKCLFEIAEKRRIRGLYFAGWRNYRELPAYYALASCLILPSLSEPWGLVVNEAMACALPVLVSNRCGCLPELCKSGVNCYDFDPHDTEEITRLMFRMSDGDEDLGPMGEASRRIISDFTPETWAENLENCIQNTIGEK